MGLDLAGRIRETSWKLMIEVADGVKHLPSNPFTKSDLIFDYSKIHPKYHASENPNDEVILYKGAIRGFHDSGFLSRALEKGLVEHIREVKEIIESGDDNLIHDLFDEHTSYYHHTGLLSSTFNPAQAQVFASTNSLIRKREDKTIYQIKIKANRTVLDYYDTGHCGIHGEILILGAIFPDEISAIKIKNDDLNSELISSCGHYIRHHPEEKITKREVRDVSNWHYLR